MEKLFRILHLNGKIWHVGYDIRQLSYETLCVVCKFDIVSMEGGVSLKITIQTSEITTDTEITIICNSITPEIEKMVSTLKVLDKQLVATKGNETFFLRLSELLYMETVDKKTFVYTVHQVYETEMKLYELEEQFGFFRAGKSCIINLKYVRSLKAEFDRRIRVTMDNGEQIIVSRQYAEELKKRLGVK